MSQTGIFAQVLEGSTPVLAMAVSGKEKIRFEHSELHGYLKPRSSAGRRHREKGRHSQVDVIGRRKNGAGTYAELKSSHRGWIEEYLGDGKKGRQGEWKDSIAVGSKAFIEKVKSLLVFKAKGTDIVKNDEGYHLREEVAPYMALFEAEKDNIDTENTYFGDINT